MDLLLTLSEDFLFTWVWTDEVLDEWERVIVREGVRTSEAARSVTDAVRMHFGRHRIDPVLYRSYVTDELSPDPDERVHAAACVHGDVDVLLTRNMKHLRTPAVTAAGVEGDDVGRVPVRPIGSQAWGCRRVVHPCREQEEESSGACRRVGRPARQGRSSAVRWEREALPRLMSLAAPRRHVLSWASAFGELIERLTRGGVRRRPRRTVRRSFGSRLAGRTARGRPLRRPRAR